MMKIFNLDNWKHNSDTIFWLSLMPIIFTFIVLLKIPMFGFSDYSQLTTDYAVVFGCSPYLLASTMYGNPSKREIAIFVKPVLVGNAIVIATMIWQWFKF